MLKFRKQPTSTREAVLQAAAELLARNPGATLEDIARAAGVGRATLHRHFASRSDLLRAVGLAAMDSIEAALKGADLGTGTAHEVFARLIEALCPVGEQAHFLLYAADLYEDPELKRAEAKIGALIDPVIQRAKMEGVLRIDVPDAWLSAAMEALIYASWSAVFQGAIAPNDAPRLLLDTLLRGIGPAAPRAAEAKPK